MTSIKIYDPSTKILLGEVSSSPTEHTLDNISVLNYKIYHNGTAFNFRTTAEILTTRYNSSHLRFASQAISDLDALRYYEKNNRAKGKA